LHTRYMGTGSPTTPLQKPSPTFKIGRTRNSSTRKNTEPKAGESIAPAR
jgi:hypothetical protein